MVRDSPQAFAGGATLIGQGRASYSSPEFALPFRDHGIPMAVYVDEAIWSWQGLKWCHLLADGNDELHRFAAQIGLHRSSYQGPPRTSAPHYDLTSFERRRAIALGAKPCNRNEIIAVFRLVRVRQQLRRPAQASGRR
jgi:hypothetical protein